jgi:hypothetical protein
MNLILLFILHYIEMKKLLVRKRIYLNRKKGKYLFLYLAFYTSELIENQRVSFIDFRKMNL